MVEEVVCSKFLVGRVLSMVVEGPTRSVRGGKADGVVVVLGR